MAIQKSTQMLRHISGPKEQTDKFGLKNLTVARWFRVKVFTVRPVSPRPPRQERRTTPIAVLRPPSWSHEGVSTLSKSMTKPEQSLNREKAKCCRPAAGPHAESPRSRALTAPKTLGHTGKGQLEGGAPSGPQPPPLCPRCAWRQGSGALRPRSCPHQAACAALRPWRPLHTQLQSCLGPLQPCPHLPQFLLPPTSYTSYLCSCFLLSLREAGVCVGALRHAARSVSGMDRAGRAVHRPLTRPLVDSAPLSRSAPGEAPSWASHQRPLCPTQAVISSTTLHCPL